MNIQNLILLIILNLCFSEAGYQSLKLQSYEICQKKTFKQAIDKTKQIFGYDPEIQLGQGRQIYKAAIIHQIWNSSTVGLFNMNCKFRAKTAQKGMKIYTVITRLKFRRNEDGSCLDYIEFSDGRKGSTVRKICKDIGLGEPGDKLEFDDRTEEVRIHVKVFDRYYIKDDEQLEMKLILTTHGDCNEDYDFQCDPADSASCISSEFANDFIPNCIKNCTDEENCFVTENVKRQSAEMVDYSHIAISAISSLIFTMLGVGTIIYFCWKYWHICDRPSDENIDIPTIELPQSVFNGTLTMAEHQRSPSPKDLPPSYDELFPDR